MRILAFCNYDIGEIHKYWLEEDGNSPSQHMWGCVELEEKGHSVDYLEFEKYRSLKWVSNKLKLLGDLDLQFRALRRAKDFDVIYCSHQPTVAVLALLRRLKLLRTPIVALGYQSPRSNSALYRFWVRTFVRGLDKLLCLSDDMQRDLIALGARVDIMQQIRWGVTLQHYSPMEWQNVDVPRFISVGKSFRDYQCLVDGFPFDRAHLTIMSAGQDLSVDLPASATGRIEIRDDWIEWTEYVAILPTFDGLLLPIDVTSANTNNAIGLTALTEAFAAGIHVIASDNPYIGIDLEAENVGNWVPTGDASAWEATITKYVENRDLSAQRGDNARAFAEERLNIRVFADELESALIEVTNL
ncbi:MAG: glycosyltransferase [Paracoccaceae bacterium]|nr:glycosyltransferase [Paracoccaceae bacterium]